MDYEYDVFVSYPRGGPAEGWVNDLLVPALCEELEHGHQRAPKAVFVDRKMKPGGQWPDELCRALCHSRVVLCIWSAKYFTSAWCLAEWRSMWQREAACTLDGRRPRLILPVVYHDGAHFPPEAKATSWCDFKAFCFPAEVVTAMPAQHMAFIQAVRSLAIDLDDMLTSVPPWSPDFPIERPTPDAPARADLPRLHE